APVRAENGMVVSAHKLASEVGVDVRRKGGNAIDAAVAVGYALAVVYPTAGNIGGVDRVAALAEDIHADLRGQLVCAHHHAVLGPDRRRSCGERLDRCCRTEGERKRDGEKCFCQLAHGDSSFSILHGREPTVGPTCESMDVAGRCRLGSNTMTGKPIKIPGPDHPITVTPFAGKVVIRAEGRVIVETTRALALKEASYPPVFYVPRADADMMALERSSHQTWCPYKGQASYFNLPTGNAGSNGVWSYESPHAAVAEIKEHLAFYPDKVEIDVRS
ncbi:MAG: DUF427 domain-containing protein, partial [Alphaproteobacteria bacterium]